MGKKNSGNNIQKKSTNSKSTIKYEESQDVTLTAYTLIAMLTIAISGTATTLAGTILGKPFFYFLDMIYRNQTNETMIDILSITLFQDKGVDSKIKVFLIVSVVLVGIAAVISLVDMIRAMNPEKKPLPVIAWAALGFSVLSVVMFVVGTVIMYNNSAFANFAKGFNFNLYVGVIIAHACNIVMMIINVVGNYIGLKRYEKDGKAY